MECNLDHEVRELMAEMQRTEVELIKSRRNLMNNLIKLLSNEYYGNRFNVIGGNLMADDGEMPVILCKVADLKEINFLKDRVIIKMDTEDELDTYGLDHTGIAM